MGAGRYRPSPAAAARASGVLLDVAAAAGAASAEEGPRGTAGAAMGGGVEDVTAGGQAVYGELLAREASARGVPPALAEAVAFVESDYDAGAVGTVGELGLMQVRPVTAAMLGHRGPAAELLDRATNARFGVAYLARAWRLAGGDVCRALAKYRAGRGDGAHDAALHRLLPARPRPAGRRGVAARDGRGDGRPRHPVGIRMETPRGADSRLAPGEPVLGRPRRAGPRRRDPDRPDHGGRLMRPRRAMPPRSAQVRRRPPGTGTRRYTVAFARLRTGEAGPA